MRPARPQAKAFQAIAESLRSLPRGPFVGSKLTRKSSKPVDNANKSQEQNQHVKV
jgi:HD-like signal output (HDOD) protein